MACNNATTFYWAGTSFSSASQLYTDATLTTVAPDGWYQQGGVWRQLSGGILGSVTTCPDCLVPCDTTVTGSGGQGQYFLSANVGNATGVVLVRFDVYSIPDRCTWSYDYDNSGTPTVASEYSSSTDGYLQGLIGRTAAAAGVLPWLQCSSIPMSNPAGSSGVSVIGDRYDYDIPSAGFIQTGTNTQTMGPYNPQGSATDPVDFTAASPGWAMMVIPKPNITPTTIDFIFDGPCTGTAWQMFVSCPTALNAFTCKPSPQPCGASPLLDPFFTAHPGNTTGTAAAVFVNDWAFEDQFGVTKIGPGDYLVDNGISQQCVTVGPNGVVTNAVACAGTCP